MKEVFCKILGNVAKRLFLITIKNKLRFSVKFNGLLSKIKKYLSRYDILIFIL